MQRFMIMTTYRFCMYACMHRCMYTCVHVDICLYVCKSFILQNFSHQIVSMATYMYPLGTFCIYSFISIFLLIMEPWVIYPRKEHALKSKILRVALLWWYLWLVCFIYLRCENKQFLKRTIVYIYKNQRKCARTLFMDEKINKPSGT